MPAIFRESAQNPEPGPRRASAVPLTKYFGRGLCAVVATLLVLSLSCASMPFVGLAGADLGGVPAPDFRLTNQAGELATLSALRGRPVALTFLYTSCPDVCPLIASKFGQAYDKLGQGAGSAAFLAVTVDPERDDASRLRQYLDAQGLTGKMAFLTGERQELERVWAAYHIGVTKVPADTANQGSGGDYEINHTAVVYVIDKQGRERRLLQEDFQAAALSKDLDSLIHE